MSIVKDGIIFIIIGLILAMLFWFFGKPLAIILILATLFVVYFFRDPKRIIEKDPSAVLSPCDGKVLEVVEENGQKVLRVFLSVFNVHLQRSPVEGTVKSVQYNPGKFLPADDPKAHEVNENNVITIDSAKGTFVVKQIAGIIARRVVSWIKAADAVEQGQKIGFIKFGSQVDLFCPMSVKIEVKTGDKVVAGRTIVGRFQ